MGLSGYVRRNWKSKTVRRFEALGISPLELALPLHTPYLEEFKTYGRRGYALGTLFTDPETVLALLDLGCDPNFSTPQSRQSVGIRILGPILRNDDVIGAHGGFATEEDLYQTIKILFGRKFRFSQDRPEGYISLGALTQDNAEIELNEWFGMAKTRELMALCESPSPTVDSD